MTEKQELLQKLRDSGYTEADVAWFARRTAREIRVRIRNDEMMDTIKRLAADAGRARRT